jgi:hypothetical protein
LWRLKQINLEEIKMVFEYYLMNIATHDFVLQFVQAQGFESLSVLLSKMSLLPSNLRNL